MFRPKYITVPVLVLLLVTFSMGCSQMTPGTEPGDPGSAPMRHSFDDVQVPGELKLDSGQSFVFETVDFKAGTLYFKGYVDVESLKSFFERNMPQDGWRLKSVFRFPKAVLLFEKVNKVCIIEIYETAVNTHLEIWVAPSI